MFTPEGRGTHGPVSAANSAWRKEQQSGKIGEHLIRQAEKVDHNITRRKIDWSDRPTTQKHYNARLMIDSLTFALEKV